MATFDPKKAREQNENRGIPAGDYLLAIKSFRRKDSKAGKPYLSCQIRVISGAAKNKTFFDNVSLDLTNSGAMFRLSMLAEQCGQEEAFDLDDDEAVRAALVGKPFKARVNRKVNGEYIDNGIERYLGKEVTDQDKQVMQEWVTEQADAAEWGGGDGMPDQSDVPPPGDDDAIPF